SCSRPRPRTSPLVPYTTLFRSLAQLTGTEEVILSLPVTARTTAAMRRSGGVASNIVPLRLHVRYDTSVTELLRQVQVEVSGALRDRKSTRLNSSHVKISYAVFC